MDLAFPRRSVSDPEYDPLINGQFNEMPFFTNFYNKILFPSKSLTKCPCRPIQIYSSHNTSLKLMLVFDYFLMTNQLVICSYHKNNQVLHMH
jgi:hypothetical protein